MFGSPPACDQLEVTVFGSGYGEAIAVHVGGGNWILVDSCVTPDSSKPTTLAYLEDIGVQSEQVRVIVASHWHDDHIRGLSALVNAYPDADFALSDVFNKKEAHEFLAAYSGEAAPNQAKGTRELYAAIVSSQKPLYVHQRCIVYEDTSGARRVRAVAFTPVQATVAQSLANMMQNAMTVGRTIGHAPELKPNLEAVVVHIDLGNEAILLGSDLENAPKKFGWNAVTSDGWCSRQRKAEVYKVAHHGSASGDSDDIWSTLIAANPYACITPFINGSVRLPTPDDLERIRTRTNQIYLCSGVSPKPSMSHDLLKKLNNICLNLTRLNTGFGGVRFRKKIGETDWTPELFGAAKFVGRRAA